MSLAGGVKRRLAVARERFGLLDHLIATVGHYSKVDGNGLAGAMTYYGFLSFFPVLAIAFSIVGVITGASPDAEQAVTDALASVFPSMIGTGDGQIDPASFQDAAAAAGAIGLVALLYTGLGWLSALRRALQDVFELPRSKAPSFVVGKLIDLVMLGVIGVVLLVSVGLSSATQAFVDDINQALGGENVTGTAPLLDGVGLLLGLLASMLLFFVSFRVLAKPSQANSALWRGAALAAVGFEVLKQLAAYLIGATKDNPAFAVFGTALILLVWINYFSRLALIGASWAATAGPATAASSAVAAAPSGAVPVPAAADGAAARLEVGDAADRAEAAVELVRAAAVIVGVTWLLRRLMRAGD